MKNLTFLILFVLVLPISGCQEEVNIAAEEEAIKSVIATETDAFWSQNLVALLETLTQDENVIYISIGSNGYRERMGWEKNYTYYKKAASEDWSDWTDITVERSNWKIDINAETAFAVYNQKMQFKLNGDPMTTHSKEMRMFKKLKGDWKISVIQWIDLSSFDEKGEAVGKEF